MSLTTAQTSIIKASIPFLEQHGVELTSKFYAYMFQTHPEVKDYFNLAHQGPQGAQPRILAYSLVQYARNIDDLTPLTAFVKQIVEKHVGLQIFPAQYDVVGSCLLHTLKELVGSGATPEFMGAWKDAYYQLANLLIQLEKERYKEAEDALHAWKGWKNAKVAAIVQESHLVKSFHLEFDDEHYVRAEPGQYITVKLDVHGEIETREYSLSGTTDGYRISVKKLEGGKASGWLHDHLSVGDTVPITIPYGKLAPVEVEATVPITFFVAGVGVTPTVSLIQSYLEQGNEVSMHYSSHDEDERVFIQLFESLLEKYNKFELVEHVSGDIARAVNHKVEGRLTEGALAGLALDPKGRYFVLGPAGYMDLVTGHLKNRVDGSLVHTEQFGPTRV